MSRKRGAPAYPGKSIIGSLYLTQETRAALTAKSEETGRTDSDIIEHALRKVLPKLDDESRLVGKRGKFAFEEPLTPVRKRKVKES